MATGQQGTAQQLDRWRSFAERYVVARAEHFTKGTELQEGWQAIQNAKKLYEMIARVPSPDAQRGEGATAAPPGPMIHGIIMTDVVKMMRDNNVPENMIRQYISDAMAGENVPHPSAFNPHVGAVIQGLQRPRRKNANGTTTII